MAAESNTKQTPKSPLRYKLKDNKSKMQGNVSRMQENLSRRLTTFKERAMSMVLEKAVADVNPKLAWVKNEDFDQSFYLKISGISSTIALDDPSSKLGYDTPEGTQWLSKKTTFRSRSSDASRSSARFRLGTRFASSASLPVSSADGQDETAVSSAIEKHVNVSEDDLSVASERRLSLSEQVFELEKGLYRVKNVSDSKKLNPPLSCQTSLFETIVHGMGAAAPPPKSKCEKLCCCCRRSKSKTDQKLGTTPRSKWCGCCRESKPKVDSYAGL